MNVLKATVHWGTFVVIACVLNFLFDSPYTLQDVASCYLKSQLFFPHAPS